MIARRIVTRRLNGMIGIVLVVAAAAVAGDARAGSYAAIVMNAANGEVVYGVSAEEPRYPASLTKMMTLYMVFDALDRGRIRLSDRMPVSAYAASRPPSKLGLDPGEEISVENAVLALVTKSANDAAAVVAEYLGGSESAFAERMTARARALGMTDTTFRNASGLPDSGQVTTARDMATLGHALLHRFPHYYPYFSTTSFYYGGAVHPNHNRMLGSYAGVDGIKTGFINSSGFNLVASAKRDGRRLIGVVFGARSSAERARKMTALLDGGFEALDTGTFVEREPLRSGATLASSTAAPQKAKRREVRGKEVGKAKVKTVAVKSAAAKSKKLGRASKGPNITTVAAQGKGKGKAKSGTVAVIGGGRTTAVMTAPGAAASRYVVKKAPSAKTKAQASAQGPAKRQTAGKPADRQEALKACQKGASKASSCRDGRPPSRDG